MKRYPDRNMEVWFWQNIVSPHMSELAVKLSEIGYKVFYIYQQELSLDRINQGWEFSSAENVDLIEVTTPYDIERVVDMANQESIHITQGLRANGLISRAQSLIDAKMLKHFVIMETVNDYGIKGFLRKIEYRRLIFSRKQSIKGILSIGYKSRNWYASCGYPIEKIYPFAYFLKETPFANFISKKDKTFRFIYVGQLIKRKRVDLLIQCLSKIKARNFELVCVGIGQEQGKLVALGDALLPKRIVWLGRQKMSDIPKLMLEADCLVLPSLHDGWGAVISEAMMNGTPAICSDACGAADAVRRSGSGGVFDARSPSEFTALLTKKIKDGPITDLQRNKLAGWAQCLGASNGANYLSQIISNSLSPCSDFYHGSQKAKIGLESI